MCKIKLLSKLTDTAAATIQFSKNIKLVLIPKFISDSIPIFTLTDGKTLNLCFLVV